MERKIGKYHWLWAFILFATGLVAQEVQLTARSSRTSVGLDEHFRITFSSNARRGELSPPNFEHFIVVGGPYRSQQTQIINGSMSFSQELTYQLVAQEEGEIDGIIVDQLRQPMETYTIDKVIEKTEKTKSFR